MKAISKSWFKRMLKETDKNYQKDVITYWFNIKSLWNRKEISLNKAQIQSIINLQLVLEETNE